LVVRAHSAKMCVHLKVHRPMNGKKPHIMFKCANKLGKKFRWNTQHHRFYIADKMSGRPGPQTFLPCAGVSKLLPGGPTPGHKLPNIPLSPWLLRSVERASELWSDRATLAQPLKVGRNMETPPTLVENALHPEPVINRQWFHPSAGSATGPILSPLPLSIGRRDWRRCMTQRRRGKIEERSSDAARYSYSS